MGEDVWPWNGAWGKKYLVEGSHWNYLKIVFPLALGYWVLFVEDEWCYMEGLEQEEVSVHF